jgi:hypothetical protein
MKFKTPYRPRPIRFLEIHQHDDWRIKIYSISACSERVHPQTIQYAKLQLPTWMMQSQHYPLDTYQVATLILHEGKEGCFAIINWWIDENMLQQFVYLASYNNPSHFEIYSDKGIITCVWEMAVLWFERNAWVEHVLKKAPDPDFDSYLQQHLNADV